MEWTLEMIKAALDKKFDLADALREQAHVQEQRGFAHDARAKRLHLERVEIEIGELLEKRSALQA